MIIGGLPLLVISVLNHDPALNGHLQDITWSDILALGYTSIFGSAVSYGVYFYNATKGIYATHYYSRVISIPGTFGIHSVRHLSK
jgi:drug/metabolite transporter (DMT)-like permease